MLTQDEVRRAFKYNQRTGVFTYKGNCFRPSLIGCRAEREHSEGYLVASIKGKEHYLHRVAWIYTYGEIPPGMDIDHINRVRNDNRACNLRLATRKQNLQNSSISKFNTSGKTGVYYCKAYNTWRAQINDFSGRTKSLGSYKTLNEAIEARVKGERLYKYVNICSD